MLEELLTERRLALLLCFLRALAYSASSKWTPPTNILHRNRARAMSERIAWLVVVCTQPQVLDIDTSTIIELVDSISRDGPDTPIILYVIHYKSQKTQH